MDCGVQFLFICSFFPISRFFSLFFVWKIMQDFSLLYPFNLMKLMMQDMGDQPDVGYVFFMYILMSCVGMAPSLQMARSVWMEGGERLGRVVVENSVEL